MKEGHAVRRPPLAWDLAGNLGPSGPYSSCKPGLVLEAPTASRDGTALILRVTGKQSVNVKDTSWLSSLAWRGYQASGCLPTHPQKAADTKNLNDTSPLLPDLVSAGHSAPHPAPGADGDRTQV